MPLEEGRFGSIVPVGYNAALAEESPATLLIGKDDNELVRWRDGHLTAWPIPGGTAENIVQDLCADGAGGVWVGTSRAGLFHLRDGRLPPAPGNAALRGTAIQALYRDRHANLWLGTFGSGLFRVQETGVERLDAKTGLGGDIVLSLLEDREGSLWVGTHGSGLHRLKDGKVTTWSRREGLAGDIVFPVFEDSRRRVWIGYYGEGLDILEPGGTIRHLDARSGLVSDLVRCFAEDRRGDLWIGTELGLNRLSGGRLSVALPERTVNVLHFDSGGDLWAGTPWGLYRLRPDGISRLFTSRDGLPQNNVMDLCDDGQGGLWIATYAGGLGRLQGGKITRLAAGEGLSSNTVFSLYRDRAGCLWAGTLKGLNRVADGRVTRFTMADGLFDETIYRILEDGAGRFWMTCNRGVFSVARRDLERRADSGRGRLVCRTFGLADGMLSSEFCGAFQPAGWRRADGTLWFPSTRGVVVIDPDRIPVNATAPVVLLEDVSAGGRTVEIRDGQAFPPGSRNFEFQYTATSLLFPDQVRFRYRLLGLEDRWQEVGPRRTAYFPYLPPGEYTFQALACNNDGLWVAAPAELHFTVQPHLWQTGWFYGLLLLLAAAGGNWLFAFARKLAQSYRFWRQTHLLDRYKLLEQIGKGGMGTVYKAMDTRDRKLVALKVLNEEIADPDTRKRFIQEGLICERIRHPNVVPIFHRGESGGKLYYAMELCQGQTLRALLDRGRLPRAAAVAIFAKLLDILQDLHQAGIIHRDIKPENIMVTGISAAAALPAELADSAWLGEHLKILDFGLAKLVDFYTLTRTGLLPGTVYYLPPEAIEGKNEVDASVDFYSLGVMLYEMLTGRHPFEDQDPMAAMFAIIFREPPRPQQLDPAIPFPLSDLVMWLIEKDAGARLNEYGAIRRELAERNLLT